MLRQCFRYPLGTCDSVYINDCLLWHASIIVIQDGTLELSLTVHVQFNALP